MNIIIEKKLSNRLTDGINAILNIKDEQFDTIINKLSNLSKLNLENINFFYTTDKCEMPQAKMQLGLEEAYDELGRYIGKGYFSDEKYSIAQIFTTLEIIQNSLEPNSEKYKRINKILNTRNLNALKSMLLKDKKDDKEIVDKVFEIIDKDEIFDKFKDFNNNKEFFAIDGKEVKLEKYLEYLGNIFGYKNDSGNLISNNNIENNFYIPKLEEYKKRYLSLYNCFNMDRYVNPKYTFKCGPKLEDHIVRINEEPDWNISSELHQQTIDEMPENLTLEEKAIYIYCKLCKILSYDEGYLYRDKLDKVNYQSFFYKQHLEEIKPGSKITCFDFSRIYSKLVNEINGDITAVMILEGANEGHAYAGFYTDNVSATLEAINISDSKKDSTNDLMKAKNGIKLKGINIISDRQNILEKAIDTIYPQVIGKKPSSIREYVQELKNIPQLQNIPNNVNLKLQSLLEVMKEKKVLGNEFAQTLWGIGKTKYFGDAKIEKAYLGRREKYIAEDGFEREKYKRHIAIREQNKPKQIYIIDTENLSLSIQMPEDIIKKLTSGELVYESYKHKLEGIEKEEITL